MNGRLNNVDLDAPVRGEVLRYEGEDSPPNLTNGQHYLVVSWVNYDGWSCLMQPIRTEDIENDEKLSKELTKRPTTEHDLPIEVKAELVKDRQKFVVVRTVITTEELEEKFEKDKQEATEAEDKEARYYHALCEILDFQKPHPRNYLEFGEAIAKMEAVAFNLPDIRESLANYGITVWFVGSKIVKEGVPKGLPLTWAKIPVFDTPDEIAKQHFLSRENPIMRVVCAGTFGSKEHQEFMELKRRREHR